MRLIKLKSHKVAALVLCGLLSFASAPNGKAENQARKPENRLPANEEKAALSLPRLALKNGKFMMIMAPDGMLPAGGLAGYGLYADDTRFLSDLTYTINGAFPTLLQASVDDGFAGRFLYSNRASGELKEQAVLMDRQLVLRDGLVERITLHNYSIEPQHLKVDAHIYSDFDDMFEVRGQKRAQRGQLLPAVETGKDMQAVGEQLLYKGLDHNTMAVDIRTSGLPATRIDDSTFEIEIELAPDGEKSFELAVQPSMNGTYLAPEGHSALPFDQELQSARADFAKWRSQCASITTDDTALNSIIERSWRDLYMLRQPTPKGYCYGAGLPWYAAAFGRDQLIVGMQTLPFNPSISKEVLSVLANYQGTKDDATTEESPGKIMHELRLGEMARCREIPFTPYYGSIDSTPLWLMLLSQYVEWTGDEQLLRDLWPHVEMALSYCDRETALGGGYLRYRKNAALGNQGWKDSGDAISHKDGTLAAKPIAVCEVQGYLHEALIGAAKMAKRLDKSAKAKDLEKKAAELRTRFEHDFWMPDKDYVALALDGNDKQCEVISSNPGQLLVTDIIQEKEKQLVASRLAKSDITCEWGIRTLSEKERRYNPMSYHNGSIWPHDNSMSIRGLGKIAAHQQALALSHGILQVAMCNPDHRLPELLCGFSKTQYSKPVDYPVSCSPQAWSAGSVLQIMSTLMDLSVDSAGKLQTRHPFLPKSLGKVAVKGVPFRGEKIDLQFDQTMNPVSSPESDNTPPRSNRTSMLQPDEHESFPAEPSKNTR